MPLRIWFLCIALKGEIPYFDTGVFFHYNAEVPCRELGVKRDSNSVIKTQGKCSNYRGKVQPLWDGVATVSAALPSDPETFP